MPHLINFVEPTTSGAASDYVEFLLSSPQLMAARQVDRPASYTACFRKHVADKMDVDFSEI